VPEPFQVVLNLYNSAGELVKKFYTGSSQGKPLGIEFSYLPLSGNIIPISVQIKGINSVNLPPPMVWNGDNDSGQLIQNGMYYFKLETTDPFGTVTAYTKEIAVLGNSGGNSVAVYNSAGELVKTVPLDKYPSDLVNFEFSGLNGSNGAMIGGFDPATGQSLGHLQLDLKDSYGGDHSFEWDGTNNDGQPVASGVYTVKLVQNQLGQSKIVKAKSITVINAAGSPAQSSAASAVVGPNPLMGSAAKGAGAAFVVKYIPSAQGWGAARVYNLAGELVSTGAASDNSGTFRIPAADLSAGIYLIEFEIREGRAVLARKGIKVVIIK
jgi:flagellar hook assembly protein FlgD